MKGARDSRGAILQAGRAEFAARGLAGARVDRIARSAGVNKQLIFYYFGSKTGLYLATLNDLLDMVRNAGEASMNDTEMADARLQRSVLAVQQALESLPSLASILAHHTPTTEAGPIAQITDLLAQPIRQAVRDGQAVGLFRDDVDPAAIAELAVSAAIGLRVGHTALGSASERGRALAALLLRGLSW